mmetsp:Transcript_14285/g.46916  ORF Transcript_14285/g.46916 Transcript_14285/m.46916 type:complete len:202 (+) Transcript_14285:1488-2093(+)
MIRRRACHRRAHRRVSRGRQPRQRAPLQLRHEPGHRRQPQLVHVHHQSRQPPPLLVAFDAQAVVLLLKRARASRLRLQHRVQHPVQSFPLALLGRLLRLRERRHARQARRRTHRQSPRRRRRAYACAAPRRHHPRVLRRRPRRPQTGPVPRRRAWLRRQRRPTAASRVTSRTRRRLKSLGLPAAHCSERPLRNEAELHLRF